MMVFDLDGTLVDTRKANWEAYRHINISPPDNFHQIPWQQWVTVTGHDAKNRVLPKFMKIHAKELPLLGVARLMEDKVIVSNISAAALESLIDCVDLDEFNIFAGLDIRSKADRINFLRAEYYVDDSLGNCLYIKDNTECIVYHYKGRNLIEVNL